MSYQNVWKGKLGLRGFFLTPLGTQDIAPENSFWTKIVTVNKPICFIDTFEILKTLVEFCHRDGAMAPLLAARLIEIGVTSLFLYYCNMRIRYFYESLD